MARRACALSLLEEAGIDGIPAIVVDPKGDIGNLLLTFPQLRPEDFRPWIDESEAARQGRTPTNSPQQIAELWREGLAKWDQDGERIERFRDSVDLAIYTPGSSAGLPLTVLKSFAAPPQALIDDVDAFRDRVASATSGLLALLGIDADPVQSREFILVSNLLDRAWRDQPRHGYRQSDSRDSVATVRQDRCHGCRCRSFRRRTAWTCR